MGTPSLEDCVQVLAANPEHPGAAEWAKKLLGTMDQYVDQARITLDQRHAYYILLAPVLYPHVSVKPQ